MATKKKTSARPRRKKVTHTGVNHLQYFYVLIALLGIVSFSAGFYHATNKQEVLGVEHRNEDAPRAGRDDYDRSGERDNEAKGKKNIQVKRDKLSGKLRIEDKAEGSVSGKGKQKKQRDPHVIVLPEQAVRVLLEKGKITEVSSPSAVSTTSAVYTFVKGKPVYIIQGTDDKKFLGVLPVKVKKHIVVSAEDGEIKETKLSPMDMLLNFFSFK